MADDPLFEDLKDQIAKGQAIAIVGAGVSIAATNRAAVTSWTGLLEHGIARAEAFAQPRPDPGWGKAMRAVIRHDPVLAAQAIETKLGAPDGGEFTRWLRESVGKLEVHDPAVLEALHGLGIPITTSNYDDLIESVTGLPTVTWNQGNQVERVLRGDEPGVLHLHGHWRDAGSVVLGVSSYERVLRDAHAQTVQRALRLRNTLVFVGCGGTLEDPNFGALLAWSREVFKGSEYRHYILCLEHQRAELERAHPAAERIYPMPFGEKYTDLAGFLKKLTPKKPGRVGGSTTTRTTSTVVSLPARPPRCLGRETEVEAVVAALLAGEPIPVLGTAGIGKSTLCLQALHDPRVVERYKERRVFVRLDGAFTASDLLAAVAETLGLPKEPALGPILTKLGEAPTVLALDNLETPWRREMRPTEAALGELGGIPALALVVTIRAGGWPEGVRFRAPVEVQPLRERLPHDVFLDVTLGKHVNDPDLDTLIAELDGVPLAIELMARVAKSEPNLASLLERWRSEKVGVVDLDPGDKQLSLVTSLNLTIDHPPMTEAAQRLLALLGVLPDGIAHGDLSAVGGDGVFPAAATLRDVALAYDEAGRLRTLAPIREHLAGTRPPERDDLDRALAHYLRLVSEHAPKVGYEGGAEAAAKLAPEAANIERLILLGLDRAYPRPVIEAARHFAEFQRFSGLGTAEPMTKAAEAGTALGEHLIAANAWYQLGRLAFQRSGHDPARDAFEAALPLYRRVGSAIGEANCIKSLGNVVLARSDHDQARQRYKDALPLYRRVGDLLGEANCIRGLGNIALARSDHDQAQRRYEEALPLYRRVGGMLGEANCVRGLGDIALRRSDHDQAQKRFEDALPLFRRVGDLLGEANCIKGLGDIALRRSDHDQAQKRYKDALPLFRRVGDLLGEANCIQSLGDIALARSDHDQAQKRFEDALPLYRRVGDLLGEANCIRGLGHIALARSDRGQAHQRYEDALLLFRRVGDLLGEANCIRGLGDIAKAEGDGVEARRRFDESLELYRRIGRPISIGDTHVRLARLAEGDERAGHVAAARAAWAAIRFDHLIEELDQEFGPG